MTVVLVASDLDRTLIYSEDARAGLPEPAQPLAVVERRAGRAVSFMTRFATVLLAELATRAVVVPVTTRSRSQLGRVALPVSTRYSIAANGGVLLVDGVPDRRWTARMDAELAKVAPLSQVLRQASALCRPEWTPALREVEAMFCYAVLDPARVPAGFVAEAGDLSAPLGWRVVLQGRKLYWVPRALSKSAAVLEIAWRVDAGRWFAAGDGVLDAELLLAADAGIHPAHGTLAASGFTAPRVVRTRASGVLAGQEILGWLLRQLADGKGACA